MPEINHIRLSELTGKIDDAIKALSQMTFWVIADITNHTFRIEKNYHNFELVEKDTISNKIIAKISGKAWGNGATKISNFEKITGQKFTNNINVLINISVEYHPVYGLRANIHEIDPNFTLGVLEQQKQATLTRLVQENVSFIRKVGDRYITRNKELALNAVIQRIALISSRVSAGGEDFKHSLKNNKHGYQFFIDDYFTTVQGEGNADQVYAAILNVFRSGKSYDVVVITRGGGAQTDFLIFDNYHIGRAIAKFPIPVITGIGHQKNETIADLMAHTQTKAPTMAAEFIIAHNKSYEDSLLLLQKNIVIKSQQLLSANAASVSALNSIVVNNARDIVNKYKDDIVRMNQVVINNSKAIVFDNKNSLVNISSQILSKPKIILYNRINDVSNVIRNLNSFKAHYFKMKHGYLNHHVSMIRVMSPENILKKGFAIIKSENKIISDPDKIEIGSEVDIILSNAEIKTTVKQKSTYNGTDFNL